MSGLLLSVCPSCGSKTIRRVTKDWTGSFEGRSFRVKRLVYFRCRSCDERVYPPEAMRRIEAASPAFRKHPPGRRSA